MLPGMNEVAIRRARQGALHSSQEAIQSWRRVRGPHRRRHQGNSAPLTVTRRQN